MMWRKEGLWGSSKYYRRPNRSLAKDDKCWGRSRNKCYPSFQSQGSGGAARLASTRWWRWLTTRGQILSLWWLRSHSMASTCVFNCRVRCRATTHLPLSRCGQMVLQWSSIVLQCVPMLGAGHVTSHQTARAVAHKHRYNGFVSPTRYVALLMVTACVPMDNRAPFRCSTTPLATCDTYT